MTHLDELVGLQPLPWKPFFLVTGLLLGIPGFYYLGVSNKLLRALGSGTNAFRLTKTVVETDVYQQNRNPMSFGFYSGSIALGFVFGSRFLTLVVILGVIPAHLFFLLVAPKNSAGEHLKALARISRLFKDPILKRDLQVAESADDIYRLLEESDHRLP